MVISGGSGAPECVFICLNFSHVSSRPFCRRPLPSARPVSAGTKVAPPALPPRLFSTTSLIFRHNFNRHHTQIHIQGGKLTATVSSLAFFFSFPLFSLLLLLFVSSQCSGGGGDGGGRRRRRATEEAGRGGRDLKLRPRSRQPISIQQRK